MKQKNIHLLSICILLTLILSLLATAVGGSTQFSGNNSSESNNTNQCSNYAKGEIIVGFDENVTREEAESLIESKSLSYSSVFSGPNAWADPLLKAMKIEIPEGEEQTWINNFQNEALVSYAELNCAGSTQDNQIVPENKTGCNAIPNRKDRILCRLQNRTELQNFSISEEACTGLRNEGLCTALYVRSAACYRMEGERKDRCFKMVANFTQSKVEQELNRSQSKTDASDKVRHYMILVLYNLQERAEKANEEGKITDLEAATIIDKIVRIKRIILEDKPKTLIRIELRELKSMWERSIQDE
ncbi:MAG: hypothetical protein AABW50_05435 [Nanoarchaeota archaeon]